MSMLTRGAVLISGAVEAVSGERGRGAAALAVGDAAPDFTLPGSNGSNATLSSFKGKKNVVLAFFSKAFTFG